MADAKQATILGFNANSTCRSVFWNQKKKWRETTKIWPEMGEPVADRVSKETIESNYADWLKMPYLILIIFRKIVQESSRMFFVI